MAGVFARERVYNGRPDRIWCRAVGPGLQRLSLNGIITRMMDRKLLDLLVCPVSKAPLTYDEDKQELVCKASGLAYPIRDGIPVMLESEARVLSAEEKLG